MSDYIFRQKLLEFPLRRNGAHCDMEHTNPHFLDGIETVMEYAETLPSEDVAPVTHARWIARQYDWDGDYPGPVENSHYLVCNQCGGAHMLRINFWGNLIKPTLNGNPVPIPAYCPHCGAKMDLSD